jgi:CDP-diacylglycerol--glycerol-3-phosphate 3-phosphatidyltransferase
MVPGVPIRYTVPNILTVSRIVMAGVAAWLAVAGAQVPAVAILIGAALLDAFDGWYARRYSQCSGLGAHLDPLADKILMGVVFAWVGMDARSPWVWAIILLVTLREAAVTLLRWYSLRRRGRFIPASRFGRVKMLTQSVVGLTVLSVTHFLGRAAPEVVVVAGMTAVLMVSYGSAVGYGAHWRSEEARVRTRAETADEKHAPVKRVSAGT